MGTTTDLGITEIEAQEVQGDVTINEAFWRLDWFCNRLVQDLTLTGPPASTTEGHAYIVAASATGTWSGYDDDVAHYFSSTWHFYTPNKGWVVTDVDNGTRYWWDGSAWSVYSSAP